MKRGFFLVICLLSINIFAQKIDPIIHIYNDKESIELFNYNPTIPEDYFNLNKELYKNILNESATIFSAFASKEQEEKNIIEVSSGKNKFEISTKQKNRQNIDIKDGVILSNQFNFIYSRKKNYISFNEGFLDNNSNTLLEVLIFNTPINDLQKNGIESYLSIKYGISLDQGENYFDSEADIIWDTSINKGYCNRVTGIGRDDSYTLQQKQSYNSQGDGLTISVGPVCKTNNDNHGFIADKCFLMWGDNDGETSFKLNEKTGVSEIKRIWSIQETGSQNTFNDCSIQINPKLLFQNYHFNDSLVVWMFLYDPIQPENKTFIRQFSEDSLIYFKNVDLSTEIEQLQFSFFRGPKLLMCCNTNASEDKCSGKGDLRIKVVGGIPPFDVNLMGQSLSRKYSFNDASFEIKDILSGEYSICLQDNNGLKSSTKISIEDPVRNLQVDYKKEYYLNDENLIISPQSSFSDDLIFSWTNGQSLLAKTPDLIVSEAGTYSVQVTNHAGCSTTFNINVINKDSIYIYPNPVLSLKPFYINIELFKNSDIEIKIFDELGKCIKNESIKNIKNYQYQTYLETSGNYLVTLRTENKLFSQKILVTK